jgi:chaperonin GroES
MADYSSPAKMKEEGKRAPALKDVLLKLAKYEQSQNIAEDIDDELKKTIGYEVHRDYETDLHSRSEWAESAKRAMNIALQVRQPKNYPFQGAANIKYPLVTVAALQFGARAYPAIVDGNRIVKCQVLGKDESGEKRAKSERVSQHMSYQLIHQMEEWEEDTDVLLHHLPIVGCAFRKVYRSDELGRNKAEMIPAIHLIVNNKVRSLDEAPRVTHELFLYPQDIEERKLTGTFCDVELPMPSGEGEANDNDAPHMFLEQHRFIDLDGDGYREPYIVTIHKDTCEVVRIVANFTLEAIKDNGKRIVRIPKEQYFVKYSFLPDPKGGFYDIGFGKLLESLSETIDTTINQMLDAGHLQTAGGGFVGSGLRLKKGTIALSPGKYVTVDAPGQDIRQAIVNLEHPGPSAVLFQLLGMMIDAAQDITAIKDILTGDAGGKVQTATTTLALIEQGLKVFTAIYKRIYRALKQEFKLLFALNARYMDDKEYFTVLDDQKAISKSDYEIASMDVMPVADPRMVTDMQKAARSQLIMEIGAHPTLGPLQNPREALKRIYEGAAMDGIDTLMLPEPGPDPMQEVMAEAAVTEIENKKATGMKTAAETDKIIAETENLTGEKAERDAQVFGAETEKGLKSVLSEAA